MKKLSKTLFLTLMGLMATYTVTAKTIDLPPYYTGVINPSLTHTQIGKINTKRTKPIRSFVRGSTQDWENLDPEQWIGECVRFVGVLDGAWRLPGVVHVKNNYTNDSLPDSTLILRSYDAVFTMQIKTEQLEQLKDAGGLLQPNKSFIMLYTYKNLTAIAPNRHPENNHYLCVERT